MWPMFGAIERREHPGLAFEACEPARVFHEGLRQDLQRDVTDRSGCSRARYTSPMPPSPMRACTTYGPRREPG